ncbi:MAG: PEGA domain-containing protein, partial [Deltaproteobacteria bacterium]
VNASPAQAEVYVDGSREPGSLPLTVTLTPGDHDVEVRAAGYASFRDRVQLPAGGQRIIDAELRAQTGPTR